MRMIDKLGERLLEALVPRVEANACTRYERFCRCEAIRHQIERIRYIRSCVTCGSNGGCSGCYAKGFC